MRRQTGTVLAGMTAVWLSLVACPDDGGDGDGDGDADADVDAENDGSADAESDGDGDVDADDEPDDCTPDCSLRECGEDSVCGESCGECVEGRECRTPYKEHHYDDPSSYDDDFVDGQFDDYLVCASEVGGPCENHLQCPAVYSTGYGILNQTCLTEAESGFPGGLCTVPDCVQEVESDPCPDQTECLEWRRSSGRFSSCHATCTRDDACRAGWICGGGLCIPGCQVTGCSAGSTCGSDGHCRVTCEPETCESLGVTCGTASDGCGGTLDCGPPCPLQECEDWAHDWSCTDLSPTLCSCSCFAWGSLPGRAPSLECELVAASDVRCTCTTGGEVGDRETTTVSVSAGGASCDMAEDQFDAAFCGLVP